MIGEDTGSLDITPGWRSRALIYYITLCLPEGALELLPEAVYEETLCQRSELIIDIPESL